MPAWRCVSRVTRASTVDPTSGRTAGEGSGGDGALALAREGNEDTERVVGADLADDEEEGFGFAGEAVVRGCACACVSATGPATEAWMWADWTCVPAPGRCFEMGPSLWPGKATEGRDIEGGNGSR